MAQIDPEKEHGRLAARYAEMSDLELEKVGRDPGALTEWARSALLDELKKRGMEYPIAAAPAVQTATENPEAAEEPFAGNLIILRRYRDLPQAFVEKSVLEDAGIACFLQDDNVIRMDWLWSNAMGGIKLMVRQEDAGDADRILNLAQESAPGEPDENS